MASVPLHVALTVPCVALTVPCVALTVPCVALTVPCVALTVPCVALTVPCVALRSLSVSHLACSPVPLPPTSPPRAFPARAARPAQPYISSSPGVEERRRPRSSPLPLQLGSYARWASAPLVSWLRIATQLHPSGSAARCCSRGILIRPPCGTAPAASKDLGMQTLDSGSLPTAAGGGSEDVRVRVAPAAPPCMTPAVWPSPRRP